MEVNHGPVSSFYIFEISQVNFSLNHPLGDGDLSDGRRALYIALQSHHQRIDVTPPPVIDLALSTLRFLNMVGPLQRESTEEVFLLSQSIKLIDSSLASLLSI